MRIGRIEPTHRLNAVAGSFPRQLAGGTLCHLGSATSVSGWKVRRVQCGTDLAAQYPRLDWRSLVNYAGDGTEQHQDQVVTRLLYRTGIELTVSLYLAKRDHPPLPEE